MNGDYGPDTARQSLPDEPDLALFVATLFQRLGGTFEIDDQGRRHMLRPDWRRLRDSSLPQLAQSCQGERFHSPEEWHGAMKLLEYWLDRLSAADKERVYTALAKINVAPGSHFDFRDHL